MPGYYTQDELRAKREFRGNGIIKCGICGEPLAEHGPPPCPHAKFKITIAPRKRSERARRRTIDE